MDPSQYSYRPAVNRNVTRKWQEARHVDYGSGWGDEDDDDEEYGYQPSQQPVSQGTRSFTNPTVNTGRLSFDQGQEQRVFSAGAVPPPRDFQPPQNAPLPGSRFYAQQPGYSQPVQHQEPRGRISTESSRQAPRPDSKGSNTSGRFPPRKSSLGQQDFTDSARSQPESVQPLTQPSQLPAPAAKPLPLIRPADIYRRHREEEERRSQDSSRPSADSVRRGDDNTPTPPGELDVGRKRQPALDTVAERKSEYLENLKKTPSASKQEEQESHTTPAQIQRIDTDVLPAPSLHSGSSRYTDRPDPISASTVDSRFPSRNVSQHDNQPAQGTALPELSRSSTFGSDFFGGGISTAPPRQPVQAPLPPPKDNQSSDLNRGPSFGYRTMVDSAFQSQNQTGSPATTNDSLLRSNTTSTSEISPIVSTRDNPLPERRPVESASSSSRTDAAPTAKASSHLEDETTFQPPKRLGTNRRDSASPARMPLSREAPEVPEPQSAITSPETAALSAIKDTATEAQVVRPGAAILVSQKFAEKDPVHEEGLAPPLRSQSSHMSDMSSHSNQRSASEEWAQWAAAKRETHARLGIQDSNPTTPGLESSAMSSPSHAFESLDKQTPKGSGSSADGPKLSSPLSVLPSQRPEMQRDESFRPVLPGGWQSSTSIQRAASPAAEVGGLAQPRPGFVSTGTRTESNESIPTAKPPRDANWRSQYTSAPQAQAFTALNSAGTALQGIFSGRALTSTTNTDSEVSSINEPDDGPTGANRDTNLRARDFAATPPPAQTSVQSATRDFATSETTPKPLQTSFSSTKHETGGDQSGHPHRMASNPAVDDSPTKESENWWSDEEDADAAPAPAPLRTSRLSTVEANKPHLPPPQRPDSEIRPDADQLESDIVNSLTPKSSSIAELRKSEPGQISPSREDNDRPVSPPFAAAALAVSPGRALQEQNAFQPLSNPQSRIQSPHIENAPLPVAERQLTSTEPASTTSATTGDGSFQPFKPIRTATKEFTIYDDVPVSASAQPTNGSNQISTLQKDTPQPYNSSTPLAQSAGDSTTSPTANEAITLPKDGNNSLRSALSSEQAPVTPVKDLPKPISTSNTAPKPVSNVSVSSPSTPTTSQTTRSIHPNPSYDATKPFPTEKVSTSTIVGLGSAKARINAYNENRDIYAQPVGHLENWLSQMNTSDNASAFAMKPISTSFATPSPGHKRESSGVPSGTKQMQEDTKKLIASAGKYGKQAGVLGKGLFAKGKEKLRTASASQKGSVMGRNQNVSTPEVQQRSITPTHAPQIPTPSMATPIDGSSFWGHDSSSGAMHSTPRATADPPFSPISEVSTNTQDLNLHQTVSAVSQDQSPQSGKTVKPLDLQSSSSKQTTIPARHGTQKSAGGVSEIESAQEAPPATTELLNPRDHDHERRDSSVSDVSSISDQHEHRRNETTTNVSPPMAPQAQTQQFQSTDLGSGRPKDELPSQEVPSYSTAMATVSVPPPKEEEAEQDRVEEQTLPRYSQNRPARILAGAEIVPIARIRADDDPPRAEQRPFSFAGSESLLNAGYGTNSSIDQVATRTAGTHSILDTDRDLRYSSQSQVARNQNSGSPLPSAQRRPEEFAGRTPEEFARLRQHAPALQTRPPQDDQGYRIPGPYGQELRSPRPKEASPLLGEPRTTPTWQESKADDFGTAAPTVNALAAAYQRSATPEPSVGAFHQHPVRQEIYQPVRAGVDHQPHHLQHHGDHHTERSRTSRLSSMFRSRSKSRSRLQKEHKRPVYQEPRPESSRRNSFFKLGNRGSTTGDLGTRHGEDQDEMVDQTHETSARPGAGMRRLSKDLFKNTTLNQSSSGDVNYSQQSAQSRNAPATKKKRFSGLFGKTSMRGEGHGPARASTLPSNAHGPLYEEETYHNKATVPQYYQEHPNQFQYQTMYAENQTRQPGSQSVYVPNPSQTPFGDQTDAHQHQMQLGSLQHQHSIGDQRSLHSNSSTFRQQAVGTPASPYQHQNQSYHHERPRDMYHQSPQRPDLPRLNTGERAAYGLQQASAPAAMQPQFPAPQSSAYYPPPPQRQAAPFIPPTTVANRDISYNSDIYRPPTSNSPPPGIGIPPQRFGQTPDQASRITPRVAALHTRSRSPKMGRPTSDDFTEEFNSLNTLPHAASPVASLGTFNSKKVSPVGGIARSDAEQEKPWAITLPGEHADDRRKSDDPSSATSSKAREMRRIMLERSPQPSSAQMTSSQGQGQEATRQQTVAERFMGAPPQKTFIAPAQTISPTSTTVSKSSSIREQRSTGPASVLGDQNRPSGNMEQTPAFREQSNTQDIANQEQVTAKTDKLSQPHSTTAPTPPKANHQLPLPPPPPAPTISPPAAPDTRAALPTTTNEAGHVSATTTATTAAAATTSTTPTNTHPPSAPSAATTTAKTSPPRTNKHLPQNARQVGEMQELSGSRPDGYESEDEPVMSATAYPGQEWMPVFERWED